MESEKKSRCWSSAVTDGIISFLCVAVFSVYPVFFLYFRNAEAMPFSEVWAPLGIYALAGLAAFFLCAVFTRSFSKSGALACLFVAVFAFYSVIETGVQAIAPRLRYWHILPLCLFIVAHLAYLIYKKVPTKALRFAHRLLAGLFAGLIVLNGFFAIPGIMRRASAKGIEDGMLVSAGAQQKQSNFYYFLFDEYAGFDMIKKYYHYDNSGFAQSLEAIGFNVGQNNYNESHATHTILGNIMSLDLLWMTRLRLLNVLWLRNLVFSLTLWNQKGIRFWRARGPRGFGASQATHGTRPLI